MIMSKQCLSIEQTKHLQELGINNEDSHLWWVEIPKKGNWVLSLYDDEIFESLPTFTLQDILDLLPAKHDGAYLTITKTDNSYIMGYEDEDGGASPVFINEQAIDSAYEMMCWCADNGIIETIKG